VVDDGSDEATRRELANISDDHPWVTTERLPENTGRGAALRAGYRRAACLGFSHALQLDADGQHEAADAVRILEAARHHPEALILGRPIFDDSAPAHRLWGRKISQFWVYVETLSFAIRDPLCGFRCFPLEPTLRLLERRPMGDRMDFDPEVAVRLLWEGLEVVNVPTRVRYFEGGLSHFDAYHDSVLIARAHVKLVFGMLPRAPRLLVRDVTAAARWMAGDSPRAGGREKGQ
jgi:glycosyltransferase involved in cell wall biosynthesis